MFFLSVVPRAPMAVSSLSFAVFAAFLSPAAAQTQLAPVVVTGTREPTPLSAVTADVVVIDAERIRNSLADSVEDLLRRETGLQLSRNGGPGQAASVFIRGSGGSNTLVLIDGVRIGSATLGLAGLEAIGLSQVERIEVLRGPGSSLYGADAVGGVVQIFTRRGEAGLRINASAAVGGYGSRQGDVGISGAQAGFDYAASIGHERSEGVSALRAGDQFKNYNPDLDGYTRSTGQLNLGFVPASGHRIGLKLVQSKLNAQYDGSEFLAPNFTQDATPDFRNHLDSRVLAIDYRGQLSPAWITSVQLAGNEDDLRSGGTVLTRYLTRRNQLTWQNAWKFSPDQQLVVAYERLDEKAQADVYASPVRRSNNALVLGYSGQFGAHSVQADLRHDDSSVYGGVNTGRLGWSLEVLPGLRVRALAGTTFRAPSFNDLYFPGYGVSTIQPERGRSLEAGLTWRASGAEASATVFHNKVRDLINFQPDRRFCPLDASFDFGCASNIGRARLQGVTLSASQHWGALSLRGSIDFLDAKDADTGERLARRAAHQESLSADYAFGAWRIGASMLDLGSRPDGGAQLGSEQTLDLRTTWRFSPQWQIEAKLLNATDRRIEPARDYQGLGRQAWLGLRFDGKGL